VVKPAGEARLGAPHPGSAGRPLHAILTEQGWAKVVETAPGHVEAVRCLVFDPLTNASPGSYARSAATSCAPWTRTTLRHEAEPPATPQRGEFVRAYLGHATLPLSRVRVNPLIDESLQRSFLRFADRWF
jgi:hypothetical protein